MVSLVSLASLVTQVSLVNPVSLITLVILASLVSLVTLVNLVIPIRVVTLVSLVTICIICTLQYFQFYLAHLWTDFQSCLSLSSLNEYPQLGMSMLDQIDLKPILRNTVALSCTIFKCLTGDALTDISLSVRIPASNQW